MYITEEFIILWRSKYKSVVEFRGSSTLGGHFLCSTFLEIRHRRIAPCIHYNGVCVPLPLIWH
nr:MAG TPA: hypothetical protein [Caudoviricetes sp.]